jgi:hypothetical protein
VIIVQDDDKEEDTMKSAVAYSIIVESLIPVELGSID